VTDFLRRRIRVVAAVVVERLDQRRACRDRMLAGSSIIGEPDQVVRSNLRCAS